MTQNAVAFEMRESGLDCRQRKTRNRRDPPFNPS